MVSTVHVVVVIGVVTVVVKAAVSTRVSRGRFILVSFLRGLGGLGILCILGGLPSLLVVITVGLVGETVERVIAL